MSPPRECHLAGLELSVYGLEHLSSQPDADVAVAFALHGRTSKRQTIDWAAQKLATDCAGSRLPLIVVTLDQRNHGSRTADLTRNLAWREKPGSDPTGPPSTEMFNPSHALDMVATFTGTASDVSHLVDFLPALLFPHDEHKIVRWAALGISLGGHAVWTLGRTDPRITHLCPIIGSPSLFKLLTARAASLQPPLELVPPVWPRSLVEYLRRADPDQSDLVGWQGRDVFVVCGADDKLVPHEAGGTDAFVDRLRGAGVDVKLYVEDGTGHACSPAMIDRCVAWLRAGALVQ